MRSLQIGKLANTTVIVIELFLLHLVITLALAGTIAAQNVPHMPISSDFLFSASIGAQGFLWSCLALLLMNIFPESCAAKGVSIGILGGFYILRMYSDIKAVHLSWFNSLSCSYLTDVYVKDNWFSVLLTLLLAVILLVIAYLLELVGMFPQATYLKQQGKHTPASCSRLFPAFFFVNNALQSLAG